MINKTLNKKPKGLRVLHKNNRSRSKVLVFLFLVIFSAIIYKLFVIQVLDHEFYASKVKRQVEKKVTHYAPRGEIYDRNFIKLAENIGNKYAFGINTKKVSNKKSLAKRIALKTKKSYKGYYNKLKKKNGFLWVTNDLSETEKRAIKDTLTIDESYAASFVSKANRVYPGKRVASQILGYVDFEGVGVTGIEKEFEEDLKGKDGWEYVFRDAKQKGSFNFNIRKKEPVKGNSVVLTIDKNFQAIVDDELEIAVKKWKAKKATAILLEPKTGEIISMSSYPNFDPNAPGEYKAFARKNKTITDSYEPGSTFKGITAAILIEENKVTEDEVFYCDNAGYKVSRRTIKDSHKHENPNLTFSQVIEQSSNVGTVKAVMRLEESIFFKYLKLFGFGNKTDIELTGEVRGIFAKLSSWSISSQPTISFGQGISVTPLQLVMAYGALANGGSLMKPMIVKGILTPENEILKRFEPVKIRDIISEKTSRRVRKILRGVITKGNSKQAEVEGLLVAGKTGTSQKVENGRYSKVNYDASFIGMFPYDNPKLVCLVVVDSPKPYHWGNKVAAPIFKNIVERIYINNKDFFIANNDKDSRKKLTEITPSLIGLSVEDAEKILNSKNINYLVKDDRDGLIKFQSFSPFSFISKKDTILISTTTSSRIVKNGLGKRINNKVPNVVNLSLRNAISDMHKAGISIEIIGEGNVYKQSTEAGLKKEEMKVCSLYCKPLFAFK